MQIANYVQNNRVEGNLVNITFTAVDAEQMGIHWPATGSIESFVWYERDLDKLVICFNRKLVPGDRKIIAGRVINNDDPDVVLARACGVIKSTLNSKGTPARKIGFMCHTLGLGADFLPFGQMEYDARVSGGKMAVYLKKLRAVGKQQAQQDLRRTTAGLQAAGVLRHSNDTPSATIEIPAPEPRVQSVPAQAPAAVTSTNAADLRQIVKQVQEILDNNPDIVLEIDSNRKVRLILA